MHDELAHLLGRMMEEYQARGTAYMSLIRSDLIRFLSLANRHLSIPAQANRPIKGRGMHALKEVLRTMEFQLDYSWTRRSCRT